MTAQEFRARSIKAGQMALILCIIANFVPGIYLWIVHGIIPSVPDIFQLWLLAAGAFGVSWVVQPIAYYSSLGTAGTYLSWVVGSVVDIRLPAVTMAQEIAKAEAVAKPEYHRLIANERLIVRLNVSNILFCGTAARKLIPYLPHIPLLVALCL